MREDSRPVQRVINALGRRDAVEACGLADGPIVLAMRHSQPRKLWCLNLKTARKVLIIKAFPNAGTHRRSLLNSALGMINTSIAVQARMVAFLT